LARARPIAGCGPVRASRRCPFMCWMCAGRSRGLPGRRAGQTEHRAAHGHAPARRHQRCPFMCALLREGGLRCRRGWPKVLVCVHEPGHAAPEPHAAVLSCVACLRRRLGGAGKGALLCAVDLSDTAAGMEGSRVLQHTDGHLGSGQRVCTIGLSRAQRAVPGRLQSAMALESPKHARWQPTSPMGRPLRPGLPISPHAPSTASGLWPARGP
jgi:hypothetical protein